MLSHTSTTTTVHTITLDGADTFFYADVPAGVVHKITVTSINGVLKNTCKLVSLAERPDLAPPVERLERWADDDRILDVFRRVGLVDPAIFTADWAVRILQERRLNPNDRLILCVKALREVSGRALGIVDGRELAISIQDRFPSD